VRPRKLTDADVAWVLSVYAARRALPTSTQMAKKLGVSRQMISNIGVKVELCDTVSGFDGAQSQAQRRSG